MSIPRLLLVCVLAFVSLYPGSAVSPLVQAAPADGVRLIAADDHAMILEMTVSAPDVETVMVNGMAYDRLVFANTTQTMTPGAPQVALVGTLVGLPSVAGVALQVLEQDSQTRRGLRLAPAPGLRLSDAAAQLPSVVEDVLIADPAYYAVDALYPASAAELGEIGLMRDQAVAQVRFFPIQYNPVTNEVHVHRRMRVRVSWDAGSGLAAVSALSPTLSAYEHVLQTTLVNYANLDRPPVVSPDRLNGSIERGMALAGAEMRLKVSVDTPGLYIITASDMAQAGMALTGLDPRTLKLSQRGRDIPIMVSGQDDGRFDADDYLLFYGVGLDTLYTDTNVYWLTAGGAPGQRMATRDVTPGSATPPLDFPAMLHAEQNSDYWRAMPAGADQDHWFWGARLSAPASRTYTLRLNNISTSASQATVRVRLKGFSDLPGVNPDHHTRIYLNDTRIDDQQWDGQAVFDHTVQVAHALLRNGDNSIRVETVGLPDPHNPGELRSPDQIWVNWIEIDYRDRFVAEANELAFAVPGDATYGFQVSDFSTDNISLFDISDAASVVQLTGAMIAADGNRYQLHFQDTATSATRYLAQATAGYKTPLALEARQPSRWKNVTNSADYILITHHDFLDAAQRLAEHRSAAGLRVALVDVADLYDEFTHGIFDPAALRDFLAYAYQNWQSPAPSYVMLIGDAYWDYRDYKQTGTPNYVPIQTVQTAILGDTPSDNWFVAVSGGDSLPDMLVGRVSVQTPQQAGAVVDKIIAYDHSPPSDAWNRRALLVADDDDPNFVAYSEAVAERLPDTFTLDRVYATQYPPGNPPADIADAINRGTLLVHYNGHGKAYGWGTWGIGERIFDRDPDISGLDNNGKLPVVVVANCLNGFFVGATSEVSLAEEFQRLENRGAIAVWAATALDYPSGHHLLMNHFYDALFTDARRNLGVATTQAKIKTYAQSDFWGGLVDMYILFGDPATEIGVPLEDLPREPPAVVQTSPASGASAVALDTEIRVVFSQPMHPDTVVVSGLDDLVLMPAWDATYTSVTYAHTGFAPGQTRSIQITGQSAIGKPLPQAYTWSFSTIPPISGPETVAISGPQSGTTGIPYSFGAIVASNTRPTSYAWQATDQDGVTHTDGASQDVVRFTWGTPGEKIITVTTTNARGTATITHAITISPPTLSGVQIVGPETGRTGQEYSFNARISPLTARLPVTYTWQATGQAPVTHPERHSSSDVVHYTWATTGEKIITVTATNLDGTAWQNSVIRIGLTPTDAPKMLLFMPLVVR